MSKKSNYKVTFCAKLSDDDVRAMKNCFYDAMEEAMEITGCHNLTIDVIDDEAEDAEDD